MKALQFGADPEPWPTEIGSEEPKLMHNLAGTPMALVDIAEPVPITDQWLVIRNRVTGICGSDIKQVLLDFDDSIDNAMSAFISFPQVLGHEVVGTVESMGSDAGPFEVGQRVLLFPNTGCAARGIHPACPACERGDYSICENWWSGDLTPGIHSGNSSDATGGFAPLVPAHRSMVFAIPDSVDDELAVLADPWSVSFHAITRNPPAPGSTVLVHGAGALGQTAAAILTQLYDCRVAVVARWDAQASLARSRGVTVFRTEPGEASAAADLITEIAEWSGATLRQPLDGNPLCYPGRVDIVYDTVGSPQTVEIAIRVLCERGTLVEMGVGAPGRFEWTPWYFKELNLRGSNAFGVETFENKTAHAYEHFFDLISAGRVDLSGMLTHHYALDDWREAFTDLVHAEHTGAIKAVFDYRPEGE